MSTTTFRRTEPRAVPTALTIPLLRNGDRLSQPEFHRRYEAYPDKTKFELIDGVVYMASPMSVDHSFDDVELSTVFGLYKAATPGVRAGANPTVILGDFGEPQPDHLMFVSPEYGGRTTRRGKYLAGGPELVAEVAFTSVSIDLHGKKYDYRRGGVCEYIVVCLEEEVVRWFDLTQDRELAIDDDGILKSWMFPGLWIDLDALFDLDTNRLVKVLQQGLATPEHAAFVARLEASRAAQAPPPEPVPKPTGKKPNSTKGRKRKK